MRFGAFLLAPKVPGDTYRATFDRAVATAIAAEAAGFDDVWIAEHHFMSYGVCPSATTLAGYLLGATSGIDVGTAVSVLSIHHPVALAEQAALLDQVSGGRFRLGVGRGGPWIDLEVFGTGTDRYERDFPESLDLLLAALRSGAVRGDGPAFRFREVEVVPEPATPRAAAVTVACTSVGTLELAASRGLPMLLGMDMDDERKAEFIRRYEEVGGPAGAPHVAASVAHVANTRAEAVAEMRRTMPRWLEPGLAGYRTVDGRPRQPRDPVEYVRRLSDLHPVGSPEDCVRTISTTIERTGVGHLIFLVEVTGDAARTIETVERLGAEVLPNVSDRPLPSEAGPG